MPGVAAAVVGALGSFGTAIVSFATSLQGAYAIASTIYGAARARREARRARDAYNASLQDRLITFEQPNGARQRIYGRVRTGGTILFKGTHGDNKEQLVLVIELASHAVDAIEEVWLDDKPVTINGSGFVTSDPWVWKGSPLSVTQSITLAGGVWTGPLPSGWIVASLGATQFAPDGSSQLVEVTHSAGTVTVTGSDGPATLLGQATNDRNLVAITRYTNSPNLAPFLQGLFGNTLIQNTDTFAGRALLLVQMSYSQDVFPSGIPRITAVVRGAQITDPRNGSTAWTENPAVIAWDWVRYQYGGARPTGQLVQADFSAAANVCDVSTVFSLAGGGTETRPLYQCGFVVPLDASPQDTLDQIIRSMAGRWAWAGGKLRVVAGSYRAPVFTIDETLISDAEGIDIVPQVASSELFNIGRTYFSDAAQGYLEAIAPEQRSQVYIDADGEELVRETRLPTVTRSVHAQNITAIDMRDLRDSLSVKLPLKFGAYVLEVFDTVSVTLPAYGWNAKAFEIMGWSFSLQGAIIAELKEHSATTYQVDAGLGIIDAAPNTALPSLRDIAPVNGFGVSAEFDTLDDGQIITKVVALWNLSTDIRVLQQGNVVVEWQRVGQEPQVVSWINQSSVVVPLVNQSGQTIISVNAGSGGELTENNWQRERTRGDVTKLAMTTLKAGAVYAFRAYNESTLGVRSALSNQLYLRVPEAPLVGTGGIVANAVTEVVSVNGANATAILIRSNGSSSSITTTLATAAYSNTSDLPQTILLAGSSFLAASSVGIGGDLLSFEYSISGGGGAAAWSVPDSYTPLAPVNSHLEIKRSLSLAAGQTITTTLKMYSERFHAPGSPGATLVTVESRGAHIRLEAIKR